MLCLDRKAGEEILIGPDIKIVVLKIEGGRVTLGIKAPKSMVIMRTELTTAGSCVVPPSQYRED